MHKYNDGNQERSLKSGYCGVRALVIITGLSWKEAEAHLRTFTKNGKGGNASLSKGIYKEDYDAALKALGFKWVSAPKFVGRKARASDLTGRVIGRQARHYTAIIDGVVNDIWDCSHKMIYGYWERN